MLTSDLPFEILSQVADFLQISDKISCSLTCKAWRVPFQESLLRNLEIDSVDTLEKICAIVNHSPTKSEYSQLTQTICLTKDWDLYTFICSDIFKTFLNLKHLSISSLVFPYGDIDFSYYTGQWKSIISLKIRARDENWGVWIPTLARILTNCPNLQEFDIGAYGDTIELPFTVHQMNSIHKGLPKLSYAKAFIELKDKYFNVSEPLSDTPPALSVTKLDINFLYKNNRAAYCSWLYYACYKYQNLRTLIWSVRTAYERRFIRDNKEKELLALDPNTKVFPCLETIEFCVDDDKDWLHTAFWDLLCRSPIPIKSLKYTALSSTYDSRFLNAFFRQLLQAFSKTLETFFFERDFCINEQDIFIPDFGYCPRLVNLEISDFNISLEINNILDNCTAIRRLKYSNGYLRIGVNTHDKNKQHGLKEFILNSVIAKSSVFNYISLRCRRLDHMSLTRTQIGGPISSEFESLSVDMSYTQFKLLEMHCVQFYSSEEEMNTNTAINMMLLSQLTTPVDPTENKADCDPISGVESIGLFHCLCKKSRFTCESGIAQRQIKVFHDTPEYNQDCKFKESVGISHAERYFYYHDLKNKLRTGLCKGFTEFKCRNITKYNFSLLCKHNDD